MGWVPPTLEDYAKADYGSFIFAISRTLHGSCVRSCHWLLEHECSGSIGGGRCMLPSFHKGVCLCEPCRTHICHRVSQNVARADGNTLLDEFEDTVSCNVKWRKKYPQSMRQSRKSKYCLLSPELHAQCPRAQSHGTASTRRRPHCELRK